MSSDSPSQTPRKAAAPKIVSGGEFDWVGTSVSAVRVRCYTIPGCAEAAAAPWKWP